MESGNTNVEVGTFQSGDLLMIFQFPYLILKKKKRLKCRKQRFCLLFYLGMKRSDCVGRTHDYIGRISDQNSDMGFRPKTEKNKE
jgi:hypothetical protein